MEGSQSYFARRAAEEREAATRAAHPLARQAHLDLADRYDDRARADGTAVPHLVSSNGGAA